MQHQEAAVTRTTSTGAGASGPLADPASITWQTTASSGGFQTLTFYIGGRVLEQFKLSTAEAAAMGTALGGTGGAPVAAKGP